MKKAQNRITEPSYYQKGIQPIDYIESWGMGYCEGNILKYLTRFRYKNGMDDLNKLSWYLDRLKRQYAKKCKN